MRVSFARLREVPHYNPMTGVFTWRVDVKGRGGVIRAGTVAGHANKDGYIEIGIDGKHYLAHRLAWFYVHAIWPPRQVDHEDTIRNHNRIGNLRLATNAENHQNLRRARIDSKSGILGVSWNKRRGKWRAQIVVNGRNIALGHHDTPEAAEAAYRAAKAEHHPFHTCLNDGLEP